MPNFIGDQLVIRALHHKTDPAALAAGIKLFERRAGKKQLALSLTMMSQRRLEQPQQSRFAAAGRAAEC